MENTKKTSKNKTETFIYKLFYRILNRIKYPLSRLKSVHEQIKSIDMSELEDEVNKNPYQVFFNWLLESLQYGFVITIVYYWFMTGNWWIAPFAFGFVRWLFLDIVGNTRKLIK